MTRSTITTPATRRPTRAPAGRPVGRRSSVRHCESTTRPALRSSAGTPVRAARSPLLVAAPSPRWRQDARRDSAWRLTRRGRVLLVLLAAALLVVVFSIGRVTSQAAGAGKPASRPTVVVQSGETLWQLAHRIAPGADPRVTVDRIMTLNNLSPADQVRPGQQIILPR